MSYIESHLSRDDWLTRVYQKSNSKGSAMVAKESLANFEYFCQKAYNRSADTVIEDIKKEPEEKTYVVLNKFVDFMSNDHPDITIKKNRPSAKDQFLKKKNPSTIRLYFGFVRSYMHSKGLKTHLEDVRHWVSLPTRLRYEPKSLTVEELRMIVGSASPKRKALYLTLIGSGARIGEAVQIRKKDIDLNTNPVEIHIPAGITKTKTARTTYLSSEAKPWVVAILNKISDDDLVFGTSEDSRNSVYSEMKYFESLRDRLGLRDRYESKRHKVTIHAMRAFIATKAAKVHDENYAHGLIGHSKYLGQYIRLSREELADMYKKVEPELFIFDVTKTEHELSIFKAQKLDFEELTKKYEQIAVDLEKMKQWKETYEKYQESS